MDEINIIENSTNYSFEILDGLIDEQLLFSPFEISLLKHDNFNEDS